MTLTFEHTLSEKNDSVMEWNEAEKMKKNEIVVDVVQTKQIIAKAAWGKMRNIWKQIIEATTEHPKEATKIAQRKKTSKT